MSYTQTKSGIYVPERPQLTKINGDVYNGRNIPNAPLKSAAMMDYYAQQFEYLENGYHKNGVDLTRWHYYFINFCYFEMLDKNDNPVFMRPFYTQEDDYVFKAMEDAYNSSLVFLLMTARGFGKSSIVASVVDYHFTLVANSLNIISASYVDPADTLMDFIGKSLNAKDPAWFVNKLYNSPDEYIEAGWKTFIDGAEKVMGSRSRIDKMVYDANAGATRSTRPNTQVLEEIGNWKGPARLLDCYSQSIGSWYRGSTMTCFPMMTGTGGNMKSGASRDAKDMMMNPLNYGIFALNYQGLKRGYFIPSYCKTWGYYDTETGVSDMLGAKAYHEAQRQEKVGTPMLLMQYIQEYPFDLMEMFMVKGQNNFPQDKIAHQRMMIAMNVENPEFPKGERGDLHYVRDKSNGRITGVEWSPDINGPMVVFEHPQNNPITGLPHVNLYVAGIDSIDQAVEDSASSTEGSRFAMLVKKRFLNVQSTYNMYVCRYVDRPLTVNEAYDRALKISMYYNCRINLEYTKITIMSYFKERGQYWRFISRPAIAQTDRHGNNPTTLIGTQMTVYIKTHMQNRIQGYLNEYCGIVYDPDLLANLQEYDPDYQTLYDDVVAMGMCEIADEDLIGIDATPEPPKNVQSRGVGYYIDPRTGHRRFGVLPKPGWDNYQQLEVYQGSAKAATYSQMAFS